MRTIKFLSMMAIASFLFVSCSDDDDNPDPVNEEEVITTMEVTLTAQGSGETITLLSRDLDADGPTPPEVSVSGNLTGNVTYDGAIILRNETETPPEVKNTEIAEEDDEHQFIFETSGAIGPVEYGDFDDDGNPLGLTFTVTTFTAGPGTLTITLRHEPTKPNDGTLAGAGGETDIAQTFSLLVTD